MVTVPEPSRAVLVTFLDAVQTANGLLDAQQDALLNFLGTGAGIRYGDRYGIKLEVRKDLLLDPHGAEHSADEAHEHDQIGRDRVAGHPGDWAAGGGVLQIVEGGIAVGEIRAVHGVTSAVESSMAESFMISRGMPAMGAGRLVVIRRSPSVRPVPIQTVRSSFQRH